MEVVDKGRATNEGRQFQNTTAIEWEDHTDMSCCPLLCVCVRCFPPRQAAQDVRYPSHNSTPSGTCNGYSTSGLMLPYHMGDGCQEIETFSTPLPENEHSDSKVRGTTASIIQWWLQQWSNCHTPHLRQCHDLYILHCQPRSGCVWHDLTLLLVLTSRREGQMCTTLTTTESLAFPSMDWERLTYDRPMACE